MRRLVMFNIAYNPTPHENFIHKEYLRTEMRKASSTHFAHARGAQVSILCRGSFCQRHSREQIFILLGVGYNNHTATTTYNIYPALIHSHW